VRLGEVVSYEVRGQPVSHRVVDVRGRGADRELVVQGDANRRPDAVPLRPADVRGKVVFSVPRLGHVAQVATGPLVGPGLLLAGVVGLVLPWLRRGRGRPARPEIASRPPAAAA
jgi:signal peptidase I